MSGRTLKRLMAICCIPIIIGCAVPGPRVAIINPPTMDQAAAEKILLPKYADMVVKANRRGFEAATTMLRRYQSGEITFAGAKSSENGRYSVYMFKEGPGAARGDHSLMVFSFNPGAEVIRSCDEEGLCDVYVRNSELRFGRSNFATLGEPAVSDRGIAVKFTEDRSMAYSLLFSYFKKNQREADELIAIFLSAFPVLGYQ